ncbi:hypothetical protein ACRALDRAFT_2025598 [Sodiomyces alcalophilus JCM 7366]|uniref:uncharacterized protein n=1 Tax=Sodiomyces alcalophilus JCM 7366 TaxID=591952 RepID=UPI0039B65903
MSRQLVTGDVLCPPVVEENSIIVAAASPDITTGTPDGDGRFLSDFYAFNYLLRGLGSSQTWLTAVDPRKLLDNYGPFYHGNPFRDRKEVLSHDLLNKGELTRPTLVRHNHMVAEFLREVKTKSEQAASQNAPLLLLVFCHGLEGYSLILDSYDVKRGPSIAQVRAVLHPLCRVTLYSTACFSGGWVAKPIGKQSGPRDGMQAAAAPEITSSSWLASSTSGSFSGSIFATATIEALTSASTPLVERTAGKAPATTADGDTQPESSLQPSNPTAEQTHTYDAFCHSILDICQARVTRHSMSEDFTFSVNDDQWEGSGTGRTAVPLGSFEQRWNALPIRSYMAGDVTGLTRTGGGSSSQVITDQMTESMVRNSVKTMAELFLQTCPGDWTRGYGPRSQGILRRYIEGREDPDEVTDVGAMIAFRWELGLLADRMIARRGLAAPGDSTCILLNIEDWMITNEARISNFSARWRMVTQHLFKHGFAPEPTPAQGPPFGRFLRFVTAAVVGAGLSETTTMSVAQALVEDMEQAKEFHRTQAMANATVRERARIWISSIGERVGRSFRG